MLSIIGQTGWNRVAQFASDHVTGLQVCLFVFMIVATWTVEFALSGQSVAEKLRHSATNGLFILSAFPIELAFTGPIIALSGWVTLHRWGAFRHLPVLSHPWLSGMFMFCVLDFLDYVYHVSMHKVPLFWRFHLPHHSDRDLDVSTNVREHPGESFIRNCFLLLWIFLTGASFWILFARQAAETVSNILAHSSLRLSPGLARILGWVLITPNLHHVHHHYRLPYTDSNYGDVFSVWDRLFGTYAELAPEQTVFGIDTHMDRVVSGNYIGIVGMPFRG